MAVPKPYPLYGEPTAQMIEQIDDMFELLFRETGGVSAHNLLDGDTHPDTVEGDAAAGAIIIGTSAGWDRIVADTSGTFPRFDGTDITWDDVKEGDIEDGTILARVAANETISGAWTITGIMRFNANPTVAPNIGYYARNAADSLSFPLIRFSASSVIIGDNSTNNNSTVTIACQGAGKVVLNIFGMEPFTDDAYELGASGKRWSHVYAMDMTIYDDLTVTDQLTVSAATSQHRNSVEQTTTSTGTQNNFSLTGARTFLRCNNASALEITGFTVAGSAPRDGDVVIIDNIGSSTVRVRDENASSTAANRIICPSTSGQVIGAKGRMVCVYDGTSDRWREQCIDPGTPITPAFDAANFTGNGSMTWTVEAGDVNHQKFAQNGKRVWCSFSIRTTSVGGTLSVQLRQALPFGWNVNPTIQGIGIVIDNHASAFQGALLLAGGTNILSFVDYTAGTNWQASTNLTQVNGLFTFEID